MSLSTRNNKSARKSRAASHLAGDECSSGCGHVRPQLSDTLESLRAGISEEIQPYWLSGQIFHEKTVHLKIKTSDMQNKK